jgi:hypothetical protein
MAPIFNMADQQSLQGCKKDELKTWLKARGLKVSGRKQDLITRVTKAEQDGTELLVNREMREKNEREKRMIDKLKTPFERNTAINNSPWNCFILTVIIVVCFDGGVLKSSDLASAILKIGAMYLPEPRFHARPHVSWERSIIG